MPVNLSVKNVPDDVAEKLRQRARENHRSLQGELLAVLKEAVTAQRRLSPAELLRAVRATGLRRTPREATKIVREMRDGR
ncbi:MAG TPA: Arc family DNA-binding protein [Pseudomonadales bacterium]|nr:Arc family DNA-binding protein [Pseudomonadales bacterium]